MAEKGNLGLHECQHNLNRMCNKSGTRAVAYKKNLFYFTSETDITSFLFCPLPWQERRLDLCDIESRPRSKFGNDPFHNVCSIDFTTNIPYY